MGRRKRGATKTTNKSSDESDGVSPAKTLNLMSAESKENIPNMSTASELPSKRTGRGRVKSATQPNIDTETSANDSAGRRLTFVVSNTPIKVLEDVSAEMNTKETKRKPRKNRSQSEIEEEPPTNMEEVKIKDKKVRGKGKANKKHDEVEQNAEQENSVSDSSPEKSSRRQRGRGLPKQQPSEGLDEISDRRGTFVVSKSPVAVPRAKSNRVKKNNSVDEDLPPAGVELVTFVSNNEEKPVNIKSTRVKKNKSVDLQQVSEESTSTILENNDGVDSKVSKSARNKRNKSIDEEELPPTGVEIVTFVADANDTAVKTKANRQKRNKSTDEVVSEIQVELPASSSDSNCLSEENPEKSSKRGRKQKNAKPVSEENNEDSSTVVESRNRRGTFVISKTPTKDVLPKSRTQRNNRSQSTVEEEQTEIVEELKTSSDKKKRAKGKGNKNNEDAEQKTAQETLTFDSSPEKSNRRQRVRGQPKQQSCEVTDVSEEPSVEISVETKSNSGKKRGRDTKKTSPASTKIELLNAEASDICTKRSSFTVTELSIETPPGQPEMDIKPSLPVGPVTGNRRGTFSVSKSSDEEDKPEPASMAGILKIKEKRKRSGSLPDLTKNSSLSTPKESKKVKMNVVPVTAFNKAVNFITPDSSSKKTPIKSHVSVTPHPIKRPCSVSTPLNKKSLSTPNLNKSISTPLSVKKTPGQFSARKMPNFSKIHKKQFAQMESLVKYVEKKQIKKDLTASLNKTFTGLSTSKAAHKSKRSGSLSPIGRKPNKSLIPVRSTLKFSDKDAVRSFGNKTRNNQMESIRDKERNIIKGVRANKRFMLQMKMRKLID